VVWLALRSPLEASREARGGQWPNHSGDKGSTKYSPLDQITKITYGIFASSGAAGVADEFRKQRQNLTVPSLFRSAPLMIKRCTL